VKPASGSVEDIAEALAKEAKAMRDQAAFVKKAYMSDGAAAMYEAKADLLESLDAKKLRVEQGRTYNVDIPDEAINKMLDWDAPLSEQPEAVRRLLDELGDYISVTDADGTARHYALKENVNRMTGAGLYDALSRKHSAPKASKMFKEAGIPGIRYLDAGSRPTNISNAALYKLWEKHGKNPEAAVDDFMRGVHNTPAEKAKMRASFLEELKSYKRTRNFVVFDDSILKILSKE
jgi:hypothetical protein